MKAITLGPQGGLDRIQLVDLDDPGPPGPGHLRVRVHACSLNYHDYRVVLGDRPDTVGLVPMADGAGVIEAVGPGVTDYAVGDHVVSIFFPRWLDGPPTESDFRTVPGDGVPGYAAEVVVRPATWFTPAPAGWTHTEAATLTTAGLTAWRALIADGGVNPGDTVLVLGTGGVAIFGVQIAQRAGARVFATSSSAEKIARLRAMGVEGAVNYRTTPGWGDAIRALTGGRGVDHVLEMGGPGTLAQSIAATRVGGHISLIGTLTGGSGAVPTGAMMVKQIRLQGLIVGHRRQQIEMVRAFDALGLRPIVDRTFRWRRSPTRSDSRSRVDTSARSASSSDPSRSRGAEAR